MLSIYEKYMASISLFWFKLHFKTLRKFALITSNESDQIEKIIENMKIKLIK